MVANQGLKKAIAKAHAGSGTDSFTLLPKDVV